MPKPTKAQLARDARIINGTPEGERLFGELFRSNFIFSSTHHPDPYIAAFNEGRRAAMLDVVSLLTIAPERFEAQTLRRIAAQAEGTSLD